MNKFTEILILFFISLGVVFFIPRGSHDVEAQSTSNAPNIEVLINMDEPNALPLLNTMLRQNATGTSTLQGYFGKNGTLSPASGGTGTNITTFPNGSLLVYNATNVGIGTFGQGTSGQFLTSQGAGVNPQWSSGSYSLVSVTPVSATTTSGNIPISGSGFYKVVVIGADVSASANVLGILLNADNGLNYNSGYTGRGSSTTLGASSSGGSSIIPSTSVVASNPFTIDFSLSPAQGSANNEIVYGNMAADFTTAGYGVSNFGGEYLGSGAITEFSVISSKNYTGTVYLYQINL